MDHLDLVESTLPLDGNRLCPRYLDLVVNRASLRSVIGEDLLVWTSTPLQAGWDLESGLAWLASLSLGLQARLPAGRVELYVCRECGDLGCGALTVNIERSGQMVRWNQFGWDGSHHEEPYSAIPLGVHLRGGVLRRDSPRRGGAGACEPAPVSCNGPSVVARARVRHDRSVRPICRAMRWSSGSMCSRSGQPGCHCARGSSTLHVME